MTNQPRALTLTEREDGIAVLEINVPNDAQNTLKAEFGDDFEAAWANINKAKPKAIVVYSTKPGSFVAGADINMFNELNSASAVTELSRLGQEKFQLLESLDIPVVAAIAGACLGGGMELALACSYRLAANSNSTVIGLPEVMLGLLPAGGGTQRLPRTVGIATALDLMLTGRQLRPKPALKAGLVDEICEPAALFDRAIARAHQLAEESDKAALNLGGYLSKDGLSKAALEHNPLGRKVVFDQARKQAMKKKLGLIPRHSRHYRCCTNRL